MAVVVVIEGVGASMVVARKAGCRWRIRGSVYCVGLGLALIPSRKNRNSGKIKGSRKKKKITWMSQMTTFYIL